MVGKPDILDKTPERNIVKCVSVEWEEHSGSREASVSENNPEESLHPWGTWIKREKWKFRRGLCDKGRGDCQLSYRKNNYVCHLSEGETSAESVRGEPEVVEIFAFSLKSNWGKCEN